MQLYMMKVQFLAQSVNENPVLHVRYKKNPYVTSFVSVALDCADPETGILGDDLPSFGIGLADFYGVCTRSSYASDYSRCFIFRMDVFPVIIGDQKSRVHILRPTCCFFAL